MTNQKGGSIILYLSVWFSFTSLFLQLPLQNFRLDPPWNLSCHITKNWLLFKILLNYNQLQTCNPKAFQNHCFNLFLIAFLLFQLVFLVLFENLKFFMKVEKITKWTFNFALNKIIILFRSLAPLKWKKGVPLNPLTWKKTRTFSLLK